MVSCFEVLINFFPHPTECSVAFGGNLPDRSEEGGDVGETGKVWPWKAEIRRTSKAVFRE